MASRPNYAPKRLPNPPGTVEKYDRTLHTYLKQLIRDIEVSFQDTIGVRNNVNAAASSITTYFASAVASLVAVDAALTNRISAVSGFTTLNTGKITSITSVFDSRITSVNDRISAVSAIVLSGGGALATEDWAFKITTESGDIIGLT